VVKVKNVFVIFVLFTLLVSPCLAETYSGTLGNSGTNYTYYSGTGSQNSVTSPIKYLLVNNIENSGILKSVIGYSLNANVKVLNLTANAPSSAQIPVTIRIGDINTDASNEPTKIDGQIVGTGTLGYQEIYNTATPPVIQATYLYLVVDSWNVSGLSGNKILYLQYDISQIYGLKSKLLGSLENDNAPANAIYIGAKFPSIYVNMPSSTTYGWSYLKDISVAAHYSVEDEKGLGLQGTITKTSSQSQGLIFDGVTGALLASEYGVTSSVFNFTTLDQPIIISIRDSVGSKYNSSVLFGLAIPTTTPTPSGTPVTPSNPIAPGYVRSMAECVDGTTNGRMGGCAVSLRDVESDTWANSTDAGWGYGYYWIDTLPNHTIDAYGVLSGYSPVSRTGEPASGTRMIELVMWDISLPGPSTSGMVVLNVLANDIESGYALPGATVQVKDGATGITYTETTPTSGTARFEVTNKSTSYITVKKYGYVSKTVTLETSDFGPDTKRVELERATVTTGPTPTIPVGGVTTAVTVDPVGTPDPAGGPSGYSNAKGQQMMDYLAAHGMDLVQLCFLVTILGLMGIKLGK
jgi:hypothetical protein